MCVKRNDQVALCPVVLNRFIQTSYQFTHVVVVLFLYLQILDWDEFVGRFLSTPYSFQNTPLATVANDSLELTIQNAIQVTIWIEKTILARWLWTATSVTIDSEVDGLWHWIEGRIRVKIVAVILRFFIEISNMWIRAILS